jgi:hypothetical protein
MAIAYAIFIRSGAPAGQVAPNNVYRQAESHQETAKFGLRSTANAVSASNSQSSAQT